jgi:putative hydrolase of the HAD superfamily
MKKNIRALIFDFGNVITLPPAEAAVERLRALAGGGTALDGPAGTGGGAAALPSREAFSAAYSAFRLDYDRGSFSAPEYWRRVGERLGLGFGADLVEKLRAADVDCWFHFNEDLLSLISALKSELARVALLSNINDDGIAALHERATWLDLFDVHILSAEHHLVKPDRAIYELCVRSLKLPAGDCLFVDDLAVNVEGARAAGLNALEFAGLDKFKSELEAGYRLVR